MANKEITTNNGVEVDGELAAKSVDHSDAESTTPVVVKPKQTWRSYFWDTFDKSPEERRFACLQHCKDSVP